MSLELESQSNKEFRAAQMVQIQSDLNRSLEDFPNRNLGIKVLAERMNLSDKTLKRILRGPHRPSYQSILKIYRYLQGAKDDRQTIMEMPEVLIQYTDSECDNLHLVDKQTLLTQEIASYLEKDAAFRAIYIETAAGNLSREKVSYEYGQYGLDMLEKMAQMDVIREVEGGFYRASKNRASLGVSELHEIAKYLLAKKFSPEKAGVKGENFFHTLFEGVDRETYNEILKVDWEAMKKKMDLIDKGTKGDIKLWSLSFTDTLSKGYIYDDNKNKETLQ